MGASLPDDYLNIEAGVTAYINDNFAAFIELAANFGEDYSDYLASIGVEWRF